MNRYSIFLIALILFIVNFESLSQKAGNLDLNNLENYIEENRKSWNIPGVAIAIVKDGNIIYAKGFGVKEVGKDEIVDENTLFGIASNTKAFTASAIGLLVDQGQVDWDDKVIDYLPYFELYDPYVTQNFTIRDLLCHRSGLKTFSGDLIWYATTHSREEVVKRAKYLKPSYGFRERYGYSNISYLAAGEIILAVTDTTFDDYLKHRFFEPLNMKRTNTSIHDFGDETNIATPHNTVDGVNMPIPYVSWDNIAAAGGINSSVNEVAEWIKMQLDMGEYNGNQILSKDVCREMRQAQISFKISEGSEKLFPSKQWSAYGLGWSVFEFHGEKVVNHGGGLDGMISKVMMVPGENFGFVILTNNINSLPSYLSYEILDRYFGAEERDWGEYGLERAKQRDERQQKRFAEDEAKRLKDTKPSLKLKEYIGTYGGEMYGNVEITLVDKQLNIQFIPTPFFHSVLTHWENDIFKIKFTEVPGLPYGKVKFILDEQKKPIELKVDIPNPDFDFTELEFKKLK